MKISKEKVLPIIMSALREDVGVGDITGAVVLEKDINVTASIIASYCFHDIEKEHFIRYNLLTL